MVHLEDTFRNKRVLVTGHTGFKGGWLAIWLNKLGANVYGYSTLPECSPNLFDVANVSSCVTDECDGDIRDKARLNEFVAAVEPHHVFHLAAQPLVLESYRQPVETFDVNVMGTANILQAVYDTCKHCTVTVVTSDKCYENKELNWGFRECDPLGGNDPYSASKAAAEIVTQSYLRSFYAKQESGRQLNLLSARAGNVIGGGDWSKQRIAVDIMRSLHADQPIELRNPNATRPWQHVLEPLSGYLSAASYAESRDYSSDWPTNWNFGPLPECTLSVSQLTEVFIEEWGTGSWNTQIEKLEPEARTLRLCIDQAVGNLGWGPTWKVRDAVHHTVAWYKQYFECGDAMQACCMEQIERFSQNASYISTERADDRVGRAA